jgi:excinuclease ABC subunit B
MNFQLKSKFKPTGDQPQAIEALVRGLKSKQHEQTLLGVTGSGKTFTMANVIAQVNRPTIIMSHNKTLAAQLFEEFKQFFPENSVHYFVSYYDYYQPEAYIPHTDTYIEKEAQINEEIDRLRHAATQAILTRRDCIIVASVSCIYGLGEKATYEGQGQTFKVGDSIKRNQILRQLIGVQYERNDLGFYRGTFRVKGENIDVHLSTGEAIIRLVLFGDVIEAIYSFAINPDKDQAWLSDLRNASGTALPAVTLFPAKHFITPQDKKDLAMAQIRAELDERVKELKKLGKLAEADRIERRTNYDLEMIEQVGYCNGIENYSRHLTGRDAGEAPDTLLDFFPKDYLMFIDESHVSLPQVRGMYAGDQARKNNLIEFGWRLPSARDNRPLNFKEFNKKINQVIYTSATPSEYELSRSAQVVEQIIRPTGLLDPQITIRPIATQIGDLLKEIEIRVAKHERVLALTLTKRMAEELSEYLAEKKVKVQYLHSEIETLERVEILQDLKRGRYDVLVGINLLREGLDLPEVSLVAILNADMAGFLRNATALIQTMGRAARHINGQVIMYADKITPAMRQAIDETKRRRKIQEAYNKKHKITPQTTSRNV